MLKLRLILLFILVLALDVQFTQNPSVQKESEQSKTGLPAVLASEIYAILGRPTTDSMTVRLISDKSMTAFVEFGTSAASYPSKTSVMPVSREKPADILLTSLKSDTRYYYRIQYMLSGTAKTSPTYSFVTARTSADPYSFVIQSDSHLLNKADKELYASNMFAMSDLKPDFFIDLGDTFLNDKDPQTPYSVINDITYAQVPYLSALARTAPLFLVIGNHEGEYGYLLNGTKDNMAVYAALSRKQYYPNPVPDPFYGGNPEKDPFVGLLENYYSFTWGEALYVMLDPYWYTTADPSKTSDAWDWTIGDAQYKWLKKTLEESKAKYKFVFAHHAIGNIRGGAKVAGLYEWGGKDAKGKDLFSVKRPGWEKPVQQLMEDTGVTVFFQGHDHIFSREKVGSVVYQTLPKPAEKIPDQENNLAYYDGDNQINSGYLQVTVSSSNVKIDYFRPYVAGNPDDKNTGLVNSYTVDATGTVTVIKKTDDIQAFSIYGGTAKNPDKDKTANESGKNKTEKPQDNKKTSDPAPTNIAPAFSGILDAKTLLGCPTSDSIVLSTYFESESRYFYSYGTQPQALDKKTSMKTATAGSVAKDSIEGLVPNTKYCYKLNYSRDPFSAYAEGAPGFFSTQKSAGKEFSFLIEADPHLDENSSQSVYESVLAKMGAQNADFLIDLGDSSMAEKLAVDLQGYADRNKLLRSYWDNIGGTLPFFMVMGNHDGEFGWKTGNLPTREQALSIRRNWFPNPFPSATGFYSGLSDTIYGFQWGDALFVVLDPYVYTTVKSATDPWCWTLGKKQYDWLESVLKNSTSKYKFVFIHNLVGGNGKDSRGGADAAGLYEWGGSDAAGKDEFASKRSGWAMPIHRLLLAYQVDAVFHGHDHFFAKEERNGMIYQLVPQPSAARAQNVDESLNDYGYSEGVFLSSPGYLKVTVGPTGARVDFLQGTEGKIAYTYSIAP
jgi:phosphodiesterase/alkaline phosphatase D-like protein